MNDNPFPNPWKEIERLRADLEIFMTSNASLTSEMLSLRAQRDELLAALEAILEENDLTGCEVIARAAIAKAKEETP